MKANFTKSVGPCALPPARLGFRLLLMPGCPAYPAISAAVTLSLDANSASCARQYVSPVLNNRPGVVDHPARLCVLCSAISQLRALLQRFLSRRMRSADLQSCCIAELHSAEHRVWQSRPLRPQPADCKSAIKQNTILRYFGCGSAALRLRVCPVWRRVARRLLGTSSNRNSFWQKALSTIKF